MLTAGGNTARPTRTIDGSMKRRNVFMPSRALFRSVQAGSGRPEWSQHIDPVRSSTSMMSSGRVEHGEQAVALAETLIESIPTTRAKNVFTWASCRTVTALTGLQGACGRHFAVTVVETPGTLSRAFLPPLLPL